VAFSTSEIQQKVIDILSDMTRDWDLMLDAPIGADTSLVSDLGFASVDIIHLVVDLEETLKAGKLGFDELLMKDGQYVDDLRVEQLVSFLQAKMGGASS
jgi:acyl carrier protein